MEELFKNKRFTQSLIVLVLSAAIFLVGQFLNGVKNYTFIGRDVPAMTTITVSGTGESFAAPDIANISFSVTKEAKTVAEAQKVSTEKMNAIVAYFKEMKIDDKDVKTTNYSLYPKYEYEGSGYCVNGYCPPQKQILVGYEINQSVTVKIRDIDKAGTILAALGEKGATNIGGIELAVENKDAIQDQAREKAISDAQKKAEVLAKSLGVSLTRIISYNEGGGTVPMYRDYGIGGAEMMKSSIAPAPEIPTGENQFTSNVTIVYEIQ